MKLQRPNPLIFAHRGASTYAPENTHAAFKLAIEQGADAIELDAKLSSDGYAVVIHDQTVDRTTTSTGRVNSMTAFELGRLDAGSHFDWAFRRETIPLLDEVFSAYGSETYINVELTNYASPRDALPQKVAELVRFYHLQERVLFSSFNPFALVKIRSLLPECPVGLLAFQGIKGTWARSWPGRLLKYDSLHPEVSDVTGKLVRSSHQHRKAVYVYTVNDRQVMQDLFDLHVDGVFTDDPLLAKKEIALMRTRMS